MARKPLRPCKHTGCPNLTRDGWCQKHRPSFERKRSRNYHDWYFLPIWTKKLRPNQLAKEPFCCQCAAEGKRVYATVADHICPHRGIWAVFIDPDNLQSLCASCHSRKTLQEQAKFGR